MKKSVICLLLPRPWAEIKQASQVQTPVSSEKIKPDEPNEPIATATLAEIYVKQGLLDKAIDVYQGLLTQNPNNDVARERITQLQQHTDSDQDVAAEQISQEIEIVPESENLEVAVQSETTEVLTESQDEIKDQSPLSVLQRWLAVIKNGRANV